MARYRKKPIAIEAEQFDPQKQPWPAGVVSWPDEAGLQPRDMSWGYIDTLEGRMHVQALDWIITGVVGERYPCKDGIFRQTYEPERTEQLPYPMDEIKALRVSIDGAMKDGQTIATALNRGAGGREIALAITKLQEAKMWAGMALGEMGHTLPEEYRDEAKR